MKMKGTEILLKALEEETWTSFSATRAERFWTFTISFYKSNLRHILVRHEQGAVHAADGYARATGK